MLERHKIRLIYVLVMLKRVVNALMKGRFRLFSLNKAVVGSGTCDERNNNERNKLLIPFLLQDH